MSKTNKIFESELKLENRYNMQHLYGKNLSYMSLMLTDAVVQIDDENTTETRKVFKIFVRRGKHLCIVGHLIAVI